MTIQEIASWGRERGLSYGKAVKALGVQAAIKKPKKIVVETDPSLPQKVCPQCGLAFVPAFKSNRVYCGRECLAARNRETALAKYYRNKGKKK